MLLHGITVKAQQSGAVGSIQIHPNFYLHYELTYYENLFVQKLAIFCRAA